MPYAVFLTNFSKQDERQINQNVKHDLFDHACRVVIYNRGNLNFLSHMYYCSQNNASSLHCETDTETWAMYITIKF